ncbi:uncharacterized protein LOC117333358 [Pecten maximus]|uniref:uncharacterized protein LOC117333358 n=1 Tax=Pecten maximus TaxID=6579 RepID=UPI00145835F9|nr:uncharacterized protein LOC117333358 [Pecten maximus]
MADGRTEQIWSSVDGIKAQRCQMSEDQSLSLLGGTGLWKQILQFSISISAADVKAVAALHIVLARLSTIIAMVTATDLSIKTSHGRKQKWLAQILRHTTHPVT